MSYNGWSNYETWLVNLWYGDLFSDMANEGNEVSADYARDMVLEFLEADGHLPENGFAADIMNAALREVDWDELVEHYQVEEDAEEED